MSPLYTEDDVSGSEKVTKEMKGASNDLFLEVYRGLLSPDDGEDKVAYCRRYDRLTETQPSGIENKNGWEKCGI